MVQVNAALVIVREGTFAAQPSPPAPLPRFAFGSFDRYVVGPCSGDLPLPSADHSAIKIGPFS